MYIIVNIYKIAVVFFVSKSQFIPESNHLAYLQTLIVVLRESINSFCSNYFAFWKCLPRLLMIDHPSNDTRYWGELPVPVAHIHFPWKHLANHHKLISYKLSLLSQSFIRSQGRTHLSSLFKIG